MYEVLFTPHSLLRYVLLLLLAWSFISSLLGVLKAIPYTSLHKKLNKWTVLCVHIQLLIGLALYFISPQVRFIEGFMKDKELRYWGMEHVLMMLIAIVLITIGNVKAKKAKTDKGKHKKIVLFFGIALLLIVVSIMQSGRPLL